MCSAVQPEAWWMRDPRPNWLGANSGLIEVVSSVNKGSGNVKDYIFDVAQLDPLPNNYYDDWYMPILLPVCPLDNLNSIPSHAAVLEDWFTPPGLAADKAVGIFVSKWGHSGLYRHRWGSGKCPPGYCDTARLIIFAPAGYLVSPPWLPPYLVYHTPW
jgi:hypothetical protein